MNFVENYEMEALNEDVCERGDLRFECIPFYTFLKHLLLPKQTTSN